MSQPSPQPDPHEQRKIQSAVRFLDEIRRIKTAQPQPTFETAQETAQPQPAGNNPLTNHQLDSSLRIFPNNELGTNKGSSDSDELPPQIGRFETVRLLGQGTFAKVFLARDAQLDRLVAIKLPKPESLLTAEARLRFTREAHAAAMLSHPAIVPVYEHNCNGPVSYIVNGYCEGSTLAEWIADHAGQITPTQAARIVFRLAEAIEHAHQRGVIHRDLKPSNMLVENDFVAPIYAGLPNIDFFQHPLEISHRVRITDFGLAKTASEQSVESLTAEGIVLGTPAYMSPEQARGEKPIGPSTDVFALGNVLYELLTGAIPFKRPSHLATLRAVENENAVPIQQLNDSVPADLAAICQKCLEKRVVDRYHSAHELAADLSRWMSGMPVTARAPSLPDQIIRWYRHNPAFAATITLAISGLLIGLLVATWLYRDSRHNFLTSDAQRIRAESNAALLESTILETLDEFTLTLDHNSPVRDSQLKTIARLLSAHQQLIETEAEQLIVSPNLIESYARLVRLHTKLGNHAEARVIGEQANRLLELVTPQIADQPAEMIASRLALLTGQVELEQAVKNNFAARQLLESGLSTLAQLADNKQSPQLITSELFFNQQLGRLMMTEQHDREAARLFAKSLAVANAWLDESPNDPLRQAAYKSSLEDLKKITQKLSADK